MIGHITGGLRNILDKTKDPRSFRKLNVGSSTNHIPGFLSVDKSWVATFRHDILNPLPLTGIQFIWSERLFEHLYFMDCSTALKHLADTLVPGGRVRLCLPLCYTNRPTDMMRQGNLANCRAQGHLTWFTFKDMGAICMDDYGFQDEPAFTVNMAELFGRAGLSYKPVRYYDEDNALHEEDQMDSKYIIRPDSLIVEGVKL